MWPPACSPPGNVPPPSRRGGTCPSRWFPEGFHFARRISPCGASFFPSDGKETKGSPGETHIAVGNRFPPAPARSPPDPRNLREPNSSSLPVTVRRGRDNDCPRIHAAAAVGPKLRRAAALDQTGAPDCSSSNLCGGKSAGGSGDPPLRCFRQITAKWDRREGQAPSPYISREGRRVTPQRQTLLPNGGIPPPRHRASSFFIPASRPSTVRGNMGNTRAMAS